ncbi:MAG: DUF4303 domain-containing protein [Pirellulales bacterium]
MNQQAESLFYGGRMSAKLRKAVYSAAKRAFTCVREKHPKERFYVFGLMTNDAAQYLYPLSNSEEALKRTVKKYRSDGYKDHDADSLRWSFGDWSYSKDGEEFFDEVNQLLSEATEFDDWDDNKIERQVAKLMKATVAGLADLDKEGFFGKGAKRLEVAVMICGDLDQGLVREWIGQLNPPAVAAQFADDATTTGKFEEIGPRKVSEGKAVAVSAAGDVVASGGDYQIFAWKQPGFAPLLAKRVGRYQGSHWSIHTLALSHNGGELAIGWKSLFNADGGIERWSIARSKTLPSPPVLQGGVWALDYSPDDRVLASGGEDGRIRLWDLSNCQSIREMPGCKNYLEALRYSPDGRRLASVAREAKSLRIWDPATGKNLLTLPGSGVGLAFTPDGKQVAVACAGNKPPSLEVPFWSVQTGKLTRSLKVNFPVEALAFSSDGRFLTVGGALPGLVELWDLASEKCIQKLDPNYSSIEALTFLKGNRHVAIVGWAGEKRLPLLVWELNDPY